jgi:hypothetical protein
MKQFGLLALVLCVALFALGCQEQSTKPSVKTNPPASGAQAQPGGEEKPTETTPADDKKADAAMPAEEKKAGEAKSAEEKKAE